MQQPFQTGEAVATKGDGKVAIGAKSLFEMLKFFQVETHSQIVLAYASVYKMSDDLCMKQVVGFQFPESIVDTAIKIPTRAMIIGENRTGDDSTVMIDCGNPGARAGQHLYQSL